MLYTTIYLSLNVRIFHMLFDFFYNSTNKLFPLTLSQSNLFYQIIINIRLQIFERKIIQLYLDLGNTKTHGNGSINIHGLSCLLLLFLRSHILQGTHIMKTVCKFDQNNADIFGHCKEHLP